MQLASRIPHILRRNFLDVNRACSGELLRRGLDPFEPGDIIERNPSGKVRTAPTIVSIKRRDLSKNLRQSQIGNRNSKI